LAGLRSINNLRPTSSHSLDSYHLS
jgi:hypothetical protein